MSSTAAAGHTSQTRTGLWVLLVVVVGAVVPLGGFLVVGASRVGRFRASSPSPVLLLRIAAAVVVVQIVGLRTWSGPTFTTGPAQVAF